MKTIDIKPLVSILEQHKLTDEQAEELQKVIYALNDGRLQEVPESETSSIKLAFGKDGKARILNDEYCIYCANAEVLNSAKAAISKILHAKKPVERTTCFDDIILACPSCENTNLINVSGKKHKFCNTCGQKLDWGCTANDQS